MRILIPGDYIKFKNKLYYIAEDRDGSPMFRRVYTTPYEQYSDVVDKLQDTVKKVNISVSVPL